MRPRLVTLVPIVLAVVLVFIVFVPSVLDSNFTTGTLTVCNPGGCVTVLQYDSVSYAYGGWGGYFQTGVNHYTIDGWMCSCPANGGVNCCVSPYGGIIWSIVTLIFGIDILSAFLAIHRPSPAKPP